MSFIRSEYTQFGVFSTPNTGRDKNPGTCNFFGMENRLKNLRVAKGWTQDEAASAFNYSKSGYVKIEGGERGLTLETIKKASEIYGVSAASVVGDFVKINGAIWHDGRVEAVTPGFLGVDYVPAPGNADGRETLALVVAEGVMIDRFESGEILFFGTKTEAISEDMIGKLCLIETADGRTMVRKLFRSRNPGLYDLYSERLDPTIGEKIKWAAKLVAMTAEY